MNFKFNFSSTTLYKLVYKGFKLVTCRKIESLSFEFSLVQIAHKVFVKLSKSNCYVISVELVTKNWKLDFVHIIGREREGGGERVLLTFSS